MNNPNSPFFSIIIPAYNVGQYIEECIESILMQTFTDVEIIVVNDGSTDETLVKIERLSYKYQQIKIFTQSNKGLSATRNYAIRIAHGKYLIFLDGDDMLAENALQHCFQILTTKNFPKVMLNRALYMTISGNVLFPSSEYYPGIEKKSLTKQFAMCYLKGHIQPWACSYVCDRNHILENNLLFEEKLLHEDELWSPLVFLSVTQMSFNSNYLFKYRQNRDGSISKNFSEINAINKLKVIEKLFNAFPDDYEKSKVVRARCAKIFWGVLYNIAKNGIDFRLFECELTTKKMCLKYGVGIKYKALYYLIKLIGVKSLIWLIRNLDETDEKKRSF